MPEQVEYRHGPKGAFGGQPAGWPGRRTTLWAVTTPGSPPRQMQRCVNGLVTIDRATAEQRIASNLTRWAQTRR
jgi:hypothetical protein